MLAFYLAMIDEEADRALFVEFYTRYRRRMYHMALSVLHSPEGADDAVQTAIAKILERHQEKFFEKIRRSWDETMRWAVLIVEHTALDMRRKEAHTVPLSEDWDAPARSDTEGEAAYHHLRELVDRLPEIYRVVLDRKLILEWDNREIARALGLSENTVSTRVARGRKLLLELLREEGYDYDGQRV